MCPVLLVSVEGRNKDGTPIAYVMLFQNNVMYNKEFMEFVALLESGMTLYNEEKAEDLLNKGFDLATGDIGASLIANGFAWYDDKYCITTQEICEEIQYSFETARTLRKGIFSKDNNIKPSEYRKQQREKKVK